MPMPSKSKVAMMMTTASERHHLTIGERQYRIDGDRAFCAVSALLIGNHRLDDGDLASVGDANRMLRERRADVVAALRSMRVVLDPVSCDTVVRVARGVASSLERTSQPVVHVVDEGRAARARSYEANR